MTEPNTTDTLLATASAAGFIGLLTGIARGIIQQKHHGWGGFFRGMVASVFVGVMVGWGLADMELSMTKQAIIIALASFLADDVLLGLQELARLFGADPFGTIDRVWKAFRGQGNPTTKDGPK